MPSRAKQRRHRSSLMVMTLEVRSVMRAGPVRLAGVGPWPRRGRNRSTGTRRRALGPVRQLAVDRVVHLVVKVGVVLEHHRHELLVAPGAHRNQAGEAQLPHPGDLVR